MPRYLVTTAIETDADPAYCGTSPRCRHLTVDAQCRVFGRLDRCSSPPRRPAECIAATDGSPAPSRFWPSGEAPR